MPVSNAAPWYARTVVIAAVGALMASVANLICYLCGAGPEVYALVSGVVGAGLAVWRAAAPSSGTAGHEDVKAALRGRIGPTLLVLAVLSTGCASTLQPIELDGIGHLVHAGLETTVGVLQIQHQAEAAAAVLVAEDDVVAVVAGALEYPTDAEAVATHTCLATAKVLDELGLRDAARLVGALPGVLRWVIERLL